MTRRLYSLYQVTHLPNGTRRYQSASDIALPKQAAVRFFQNALLGSALGYTEQEFCLRPTEGQKTSLRTVTLSNEEARKLFA